MAMPLQGKYNTATVFTDNIDNETISQVIELLNQPFVADSQIRIMPDCHAGKGCVVGTTMTLSGEATVLQRLSNICLMMTASRHSSPLPVMALILMILCSSTLESIS